MAPSLVPGAAGPSPEGSTSIRAMRGKPGLRAWASLVVSASVMIGGVFWPPLGLAVPVLLVIAVVSNARRHRWFCSRACPRSGILSGFLPRFSRYKAMPAALRSDMVRSALCGLLLACSTSQALRLWRSPREVGWFFWMVCAITFGVSLLMALAWKPRSWCAVCPMGTLQDTMSGALSRGTGEGKPAGV